ncbi:MAG: radical SAM family heme chaperone HemW [Pseudomonadota bacterium]|nr:radical SAM family heme chaperone HemW [Pseudomonadota bacterium]
MNALNNISPPLSLYIHFPWCIQKCPYCDFNSYKVGPNAPKDKYINALISELENLSSLANRRPIKSIFLGGGTPSIFNPSHFEILLRSVKDYLLVSPDAEITLEANPGGLEHGNFSEYLSTGINRLSLGAQSFLDDKLKSLGRIHGAQATLEAFTQARDAGFKNINLDLMYGLPSQNLLEAKFDLTQAISLGPEHISLYHLTFEPNTIFFLNPPKVPHSDDVWQMETAASALLESSAYNNYEVSAWAIKGKECIHNLNYWHFGDYLGIGAGAHSKITTSNGVFREQRVNHPAEYLHRTKTNNVVVKKNLVTASDLVFEFMLNNLRLKEGFSLGSFTQLTGLPVERVLSGLRAAEKKGMIRRVSKGFWQPTSHGWRFLNDLQANFLPEQL